MIESVEECRALEGKDAAAAGIDKELLRKRSAEEVTGAWDSCLARWKSLPKHRRTTGDQRLTLCHSAVICEVCMSCRVLIHSPCNENSSISEGQMSSGHPLPSWHLLC